MYEAVNAYYEGFEEVSRIVATGGTKKPTLIMKRTMSGQYLQLKSFVIRPSQYKVEGRARIDGYKVGAQTSSKIPITGCENETKVKVVDSKTGDDVSADNSGLRVRHMVAIKGKDGRWRIDQIVRDEYLEPKDWKSAPCMAVRERPR